MKQAGNHHDSLPADLSDALTPVLPSRAETDWRTVLGIAFSVVWLVFLSSYIAAQIGWSNVFAQPIYELGSFLEGAFAPLAFLWFVLAYYSQQKELSQNTDAIRMQYAVIQKTAEQAVIQAEAIKASEVHARRESFLKVADSVKEQLGAVLGFLFISSQGTSGNGLVSTEQLSTMWRDMGVDREIFARQLLGLSYSNHETYVYKVLFGTPIRTRHSENFIFNFERLINAAEDCDTNGMIKDAIHGSAFGYVFDRMKEVRRNIPDGIQYGVYDFDPDSDDSEEQETDQ